jgi:hypothetical protein
MSQLVAEVQTSQGKDVAKVYKTPNKDHQHEIKTVAPPKETERIHHNDNAGMMKTKDSIRSNMSDFLQSINHPDAGSNLHIFL